MRTKLRVIAVISGVVGALVLMASPAFAGSFTSPTGTAGSPYAVPGDSQGTPQPFDITFGGFSQGNQVYVEQCDGVSPSTSGWTPIAHCDLGTSPAAVVANASGAGTFVGTDPNFGFTPFKGASPQGQFNCIATGEANPNNGLPTFTNCQVRISTNNTAVTADQAFLPISLPTGSTPPPQTPEVPYAVLLPVGALAVGGGYLAIRKRRNPNQAAA